MSTRIKKRVRKPLESGYLLGRPSTFDLVFVYLRPHFGEGGYCAQSRRVPVPGSGLLIKPLKLLLHGLDLTDLIMYIVSSPREGTLAICKNYCKHPLHIMSPRVWV